LKFAAMQKVELRSSGRKPQSLNGLMGSAGIVYQDADKGQLAMVESIAKRLQNSNVMRKAILVDNHIEKHMPVNLLLECFPGKFGRRCFSGLVAARWHKVGRI
jgi:hypothetical protein